MHGDLSLENWVLVQRSQLQHSSWLPATDFSHAAGQWCLPALLDEVEHLMRVYPLAFIQQSDETYQLVSVVAFNASQPLFVDEKGNWLAGYIPAYLRQYPFAIKRTDKGAALAFNADSGLLLNTVSSDGNRFFDDNGDPSESLQAVQTFLSASEKSRLQTQALTELLVQYDLLTPWLVSGEGDEQEVRCYCVNEKKLATLDADALKSLTASGALKLAYAQRMSMPRLELLQQVAKQRSSQATVDLDDVDIESLFDDDDDVLSFD